MDLHLYTSRAQGQIKQIEVHSVGLEPTTDNLEACSPYPTELRMHALHVRVKLMRARASIKRGVPEISLIPCFLKDEILNKI